MTRKPYSARTAYQSEQMARSYEQSRYGGWLGRLRVRRQQRAVRRAMALAGFEGARVADCPCGTGRWAPVLLERARTVVGVDLSRAMLMQAREKKANRARLLLVHGDLEDIPLADQSVDYVFSFALMKHLPPGVKRAVLREFMRVARRGMIVSFALLNPLTYLRWRWLLRHTPAEAHSYPLWPAEAHALADELGLRLRALYSPLGWLGMEKVALLEKSLED